MFLNKVVRWLGYFLTSVLVFLQLLLLSFVVVSTFGGLAFFLLCIVSPVKTVWLCMYYVEIVAIASAVLTLVLTVYTVLKAKALSKPVE